jgi:hypothetical protein
MRYASHAEVLEDVAHRARHHGRYPASSLQMDAPLHLSHLHQVAGLAALGEVQLPLQGGNTRELARVGFTCGCAEDGLKHINR